MNQDPRSHLSDVRRDLEYDYLALSYQISHLLESRAREKAVLDEVAHWVEELVQARQRMMSGARSYNLPELKRLDELTDVVLSEAESFVRLGIQTCNFREKFRVLQSQLAEIGRQLGYW